MSSLVKQAMNYLQNLTVPCIPYSISRVHGIDVEIECNVCHTSARTHKYLSLWHIQLDSGGGIVSSFRKTLWQTLNLDMLMQEMLANGKGDLLEWEVPTEDDPTWAAHVGAEPGEGYTPLEAFIIGLAFAEGMRYEG